MVLKKYELEGKLGEESQMIKSGVLRDENPLDESPEFTEFLLACRHGNLKKCQELISDGVNINGKDRFDYTPLIIASLCGHFELVRLLLESGALAERNTFQGERCIYNALNDRIRNLLLQYDFSKSSDPYVYWSSHISTLFHRTVPRTSDITLTSGSRSFELHKFLLALRTPYFRKKLEAQPDTATWTLSANIPIEAVQIALRYVYLGELPRDLVPAGSPTSEEEVAKALDKVSKDLGIEQLWEAILTAGDRRLARQRYQDEVERALGQVRDFFNESVIKHRMEVDPDRVNEVKWKPDNSIFADVILRADEPLLEDEPVETEVGGEPQTNGVGIPIGPSSNETTTSTNPEAKRRRPAVLYPAHRAMLLRSEYFERMFSGDFLESQESEHLRIITVDCSPPVLEIILTFLYTETAVFPLEHALELLYAADMLYLDAIKTKAAQAISTLGSGTANTLIDRTHGDVAAAGGASGAAASAQDASSEAEAVEMEPVNIYDVIHAAWDLRVQRLEEFSARYLAYRLEDYIDEVEFQDLIEESASRLASRQETDTIELLDDIRYYLSERFRLRFEDAGLDDMMDDEGEISAEAAAVLAESVAPQPPAAADGSSAAQQGPKAADGAQGPGSGGTATAQGVASISSPESAKQTPENDEAVTAQEKGSSGAGLKTLDGKTAEDEFASDAMNYQILLGKIDAMLDRLKLDA